MEQAEKIAYAEGLKPSEFEDLQPGEFYTYLEGRRLALKKKDQRIAYYIVWLLSPYCKEPLSIDKILEPLYVTPEQKQAKLLKEREELKREFGITEEHHHGHNR